MHFLTSGSWWVDLFIGLPIPLADPGENLIIAPPIQFGYRLPPINEEGCGGTLMIETMTFNRRVVGLTPALATT